MIQVKKKMALLASLEKQIQSLTLSLNSYKDTRAMLHKLNDESITLYESEESMVSLEQSLKQLKQAKKELEEEIVSDAKRDGDVAQSIKLIESIPGVSTTIATMIICGMNNNNFASKDALYAYF